MGMPTFARLTETFKVIDDPEIIKRKNVVRENLRNEYIRRSYNPYRHACGTGGVPFDPQLQRYISMNYAKFEYYRPTTKSVTMQFIVFIVVPCLMWCDFRWEHERKESIYRTGKIAYYDREYKFVN